MSENHRLTPDAEVNGESYDARWVASVRQHPSIWWPVEIGEILYNLRTSLDYMAGGHGGRGFPIFKSRKDYEMTRSDGVTPRPRRGLDLTRGMSEALQTAIEAEQPYNVYRDEPSRDPLLLLHDLRDWDAHVGLNSVTAVVRGLSHDVIQGELTGIKFRQMKPGPLYDGEQVARLTGKVVNPAPPTVTVRLHTTITIAFAEGTPAAGEPVGEVLNSIHNRVSDVSTRIREVWRANR